MAPAEQNGEQRSSRSPETGNSDRLAPAISAAVPISVGTIVAALAPRLSTLTLAAVLGAAFLFALGITAVRWLRKRESAKQSAVKARRSRSRKVGLGWFRFKQFGLGTVVGVSIMAVASSRDTGLRGEIITPRAGPVEQVEPARGTVRGLREAQCVWLVVQEPNLGYYPQRGPLTCRDGGWSGSAQFGLGARRRFTLHLVATGSREPAAFRQFLSPDSRGFMPLTIVEIPSDTRFLASNDVHLRR